MISDRWRARRAIKTRTPPTAVVSPADPRLFAIVESLKQPVGADISLGDPSWHFRWEGELQLVGLDATDRSVSDVRQRLARLVHECSLRHLPTRARRVLAALLVQPRADEDLRGLFTRLDDDQGEVGQSDWHAARRHVALLLVDRGGSHRLFGADRALQEQLATWSVPEGGVSPGAPSASP